jgi:hypothetical protein
MNRIVILTTETLEPINKTSTCKACTEYFFCVYLNFILTELRRTNQEQDDFVFTIPEYECKGKKKLDVFYRKITGHVIKEI